MSRCYCCGAEVSDSAKFCPKCGKAMEITQDLIDRAMENDPDAQTELYERTYKTVYSRIRAKVPDEDTAMDIMQETYLSAFTNLNQLQRAETFPSWLLTIASRQACDWYRKNGKENENVQMSQLEYESDDTIPDEDDILEEPEYRQDFSPDESLDRAETGRLLSEILNTLPEDQRIVLVMRYYDEMSLKEISEELGVNLSTVKTRLTAGKKKVEAKVRELEKSGTKLYSLGPVAFLVFLLHHAELFAPAISANAVIGLTAAGAETAAGGAAAGVAAHAAAGAAGKVAAGAAVKAAAGAAAKGIGIRIAAVAAAVVVGGGGVTAAVLTLDHDSDTEMGTAEASQTEIVEPSESQEPSEDSADDEIIDEPVPVFYLSAQRSYILSDFPPSTSERTFDKDGNVLTLTTYEGETEFERTEYTYDSSGNRLTETLYNENELSLRWVSEYDEKGNKVFETTYDADGNITGTYEYMYDEADNPLTYIVYDRDGSIFSRTYYTYDENYNLLTETEYYDTDEIINWTNNNYDSDGNLTDTLKFFRRASNTWNKMTYNKDGLETSNTSYYSDGSLFSHSEHEYDDNGNLLLSTANGKKTEECVYDSDNNILSDITYQDGSIATKRECSYDKNGYLMVETSYDESTDTDTRTEYVYDSDYNLVSSTFYVQGVLTELTNNTYDLSGNLLSSIITDADGNVLSRNVHTYDDYGNELTDITYSGDGTIISSTENTYARI